MIFYPNRDTAISGLIKNDALFQQSKTSLGDLGIILISNKHYDPEL